jgi:hypothetical protein
MKYETEVLGGIRRRGRKKNGNKQGFGAAKRQHPFVCVFILCKYFFISLSHTIRVYFLVFSFIVLSAEEVRRKRRKAKKQTSEVTVSVHGELFSERICVKKFQRKTQCHTKSCLQP